MDRRSFLKKAGVTGSALLGARLLPGALGRGARAMAQGANEPPNILFLMVDQMRFPRWFPQPAALAKLLPSLARLEAGSVTFREHYTAANACTPSRGCLLTGLSIVPSG